MSTSDNSPEQFAGQVRVLQIIVAAVTLGPLIYLGVVLSTAPPGNRGADGSDGLLTYLAFGMAAAAVIARLVVPPLVALRFRRQIAAGT